MANPILPLAASNLPPSNSPLVDKQGRLTVEWLLYVQTVGQFITYEVSTATVVSTGASQANATELKARFTRVTPVAIGTGVRLTRKPYVGQLATILNRDAGNPLSIYPGSNGQIELAGVNFPWSLGASSQITFVAFSTAGQWYKVW
jgi:hypothetical protein